jgi:peptide/nickel transport system ATP-binding protein
MSDLILDVCQLSVVFNDAQHPAVENLSFRLHKGQVLGIVGESGSGKSVTSLALMGLVPSPGRIVDLSSDRDQAINFYTYTESNDKKEDKVINLINLSEKALTHYRGSQIAMIFQEPMSSFNPVYTIGYQLLEAINLHQQVDTEQARQQAVDRLREVRVLKSLEELELEYLKERDRLSAVGSSATLPSFRQYFRQQEDLILKKYPHEFSGGQLQRVMIAMAIACDPQLLIADEPTTALDVTIQKEVLLLLRDLCKTRREMAMIFISHDLGVINEIADRILVMKAGKQVEQGSKAEILSDPQTPYTQGLLACRPTKAFKRNRLPIVEDFMKRDRASDSTPNDASGDRFRPISLAEEAQHLQKLTGQQGEILLSVKNLSVSYTKAGFFLTPRDSKRAVNNISFDLYRGETLGIVGESGCGKSTLARAILRLLPSQGSIRFLGQEISNWSSQDKRLRDLRREMQIVFQNPYTSLDPRMTIGEAIIEPMVIHDKFKGKRKQEAKDLLKKVRLDPNWFDRYPHQLSGGQRQRVCIARAIALRPSLIICDESVSALDVSVQAEILNLLKDLQNSQTQDDPSLSNLTYLFISHDISVVRFISDRILVMKQGEQVEIGAAAQIISYPQAQYTQNLMDAVLELPLSESSWQSFLPH